MPDTLSAGVRIHYVAEGSGKPVVLIHGYTAGVETNWRNTGVLDALASRYCVIAPDLRGHGQSEKPHHTSDYSMEKLAADVLAAMDGADVERAHIVGYSLGGMVALKLLLEYHERVNATVIGGMGAAFPHTWAGWRAGRGDNTDGVSAEHRSFSWLALASYVSRLDLAAMNGVYRGVLRDPAPIDAARLARVHSPVLCIAGTRDHLCKPTRQLADSIPGAKLVLLPGQSHLSAIGHPAFRDAILDFLAGIAAAHEHNV